MTIEKLFLPSINASQISSVAKMINDDIPRRANCRMKKLIIEEKPHLCLYSSKDLQIGDQLFYDYGVGDLPWRKQKVNEI